ncbi:MAG: hypothetical protein K8I60_22640, partial [Anaerolineae bacterium]|nr:hypothetical protein [Anaerolineae bacterium]
AQVGEVADTLTLTMQAVVEAAAIDQLLAEQVALARLSQQIPRGRVLRPELPVTYTMGAVSNIDAQGRITFTITADGTVTAEIQSDILKERLAGRTLDDALAYLMGELDLAEGALPQITLAPNWIGRLPLLPTRIAIIIQDAGG